MKCHIKIFIILLLIPLTAFGELEDDRVGRSEPAFNFLNQTPLDFLDFLCSYNMQRSPAVVTTWESPKSDWIKQEHIPELMKHLESIEPCASVAMSLSSYIPRGLSTRGREAAHLINGFRVEHYPLGLNSYRDDHNSDINVEEIRNWYKKKSNDR